MEKNEKKIVLSFSNLVSKVWLLFDLLQEYFWSLTVSDFLLYSLKDKIISQFGHILFYLNVKNVVTFLPK